MFVEAIVNRIRSNIKSKAWKAKNKLQDMKEEIAESKKAVERLDFIDNLENEIIKLESIREKAEIARSLAFKIKAYISTFKAKQKEIEGKQWVSAAKNELSSLEKIRGDADTLWNMILKLKSLMKSYKSNSSKIKKAKALEESKGVVIKLEKNQTAWKEKNDILISISGMIQKHKRKG